MPSIINIFNQTDRCGGRSRHRNQSCGTGQRDTRTKSGNDQTLLTASFWFFRF